MDVTFTRRGDGWRHRGRPPRRVPEKLMELLQRTYEDENQAVIPVAQHSQQEINEVVAYLRRGALDLGLRLRVQTDETAIRFYVEDKDQ